MTWTSADIDRAIGDLARSASLVEAIAAIRDWRPGTSKSALRHALDSHGRRNPTAYLGADIGDESPATSRSGQPSANTGRLVGGHTTIVAPVPSYAHRTERPAPPTPEPEHVSPAYTLPDRSHVAPPKESARDWPRALWDAPGELPQQYAADRSFIAPMDPVITLGKPGDTALGIPDVHSPYHSRAKMRFALRCIEATQPDWIFIYGDFADFYTVSFHDRSPGRVSRLTDEIEVTCELLRAIEKAAPNAKRVFCEGNHEFRLSRYVMKHAAALQGLRGLSLDEMLGLSENGWRLVPYREMVIFGGVGISHDFEHAGVNASRASMLSMMSSVSNGHTHRAQSLIQRMLSGRSLVSHSFGWLGEPATVDYRHRRKAALEWSHGLGFGPISDCGTWQAQQVDLNGDSTYIGGEIVRAR